MSISEEIKNLIKKFAIKNAMDYGKAEEGAVLGKVIPSAKGVPVPDLRKEVKTIVTQVNKMKKPELEKRYAPFEKEFGQKAKDTAEKTAKPNMELDNVVSGKFVTRFPPEPSGYLHIGHAKPAFLESEFVRQYKGKLFLYFDDTNPEKEKQEFVDADKKDLEWLGIKFDGEYYASDNLEKIYEYAKQLIKQDDAYVCECDQEKIKKMRLEMEVCEHRSRKPKENLSDFEKMLGGKYEEGGAILRFKGDMKAQNTVMRDPTIARIKKQKHYRQGTKYNVWPTYDLAAPIVDSMKGVTDVMRSKEYELRDELDKIILEKLGLRVPNIRPFSRLNVKGNTTHKREVRKLINDGIIKSWDDPRLMTLAALRRRGIMPEAIRNFAIRSGMSKTDGALPLDMLLAENKKIINDIAWHLFFVEEPVKLVVKKMKSIKASMKLLPDGKFGNREYTVGDTFYISGNDAKTLKKGDGVRLKDLVDVKITAKNPSEIVTEEAGDSSEGKVLQWVSDKNYVKCSVLVASDLLDERGNFNPESLKTISGYAEAYVEKIAEHEIVQFERFGYCILDDKKKMQFIFISK